MSIAGHGCVLPRRRHRLHAARGQPQSRWPLHHLHLLPEQGLGCNCGLLIYDFSYSRLFPAHLSPLCVLFPAEARRSASHPAQSAAQHSCGRYWTQVWPTAVLLVRPTQPTRGPAGISPKVSDPAPPYKYPILYPSRLLLLQVCHHCVVLWCWGATTSMQTAWDHQRHCARWVPSSLPPLLPSLSFPLLLSYSKEKSCHSFTFAIIPIHWVTNASVVVIATVYAYTLSDGFFSSGCFIFSFSSRTEY